MDDDEEDDEEDDEVGNGGGGAGNGAGEAHLGSLAAAASSSSSAAGPAPSDAEDRGLPLATTVASELFAHAASRAEVVVTFLAMLELIRLKQIGATQESPFSEIELCQIQAEIAPENPAAAYVEAVTQDAIASAALPDVSPATTTESAPAN